MSQSHEVLSRVPAKSFFSESPLRSPEEALEVRTYLVTATKFRLASYLWPDLKSDLTKRQWSSTSPLRLLRGVPVHLSLLQLTLVLALSFQVVFAPLVVLLEEGVELLLEEVL